MSPDVARQVLAQLIRRGIVTPARVRQLVDEGRLEVGALISPADYLARLEQVNTYIRALDRDIRRAYAERRASDRPFRDEWERWFGDWTEFYAANNSWLSGMTGGALQQVEEHATQARAWRDRFAQLAGPSAVTTPGEPTPGGPGDRAQPLFDGDSMGGLGKIAAIALGVVAGVFVLSRVWR